MEMFCPEHEVCATCNHWAGVRSHDENRLVHAIAETRGICTFTGRSCSPDQSCTFQQWAQWDGWGDVNDYQEICCWEYTCCGLEEGGQTASRLGTYPSFYAYGELANHERRMCHLRHKQLYTELQKQLPMR